jgi:hypothetical protein
LATVPFGLFGGNSCELALAIETSNPDRHMSQYRFNVEYTEAMVREAVHTFLWHRLKRRWTLWVGMLLLAAATVMLFLTGDRSWLLGLVGATLGFSVLLLWVLYRAHLTNSLGKLRQMGVPKAEFRLENDSLAITSGSGAATLPWSTVREILATPQFWVLCTATNQFFTLPILRVPPEALEFIRSRVQRS